MTCPFCARLTEPGLVAESKHGVAFPDAYPLSKGHTLVVSRRHVASVYQLDQAEQADLWALAARVRDELSRTELPDGFNVGLNDGPAAGQTIPHAHIHVIPRYLGDAADPRGGIRWLVPGRAPYWRAKFGG